MTDPDSWPPPGTPPLAWPVLSDEASRYDWYASVCKAYTQLWPKKADAKMAPVSEVDLQGVEAKIECPLPAPLRRYHARVGATALAERLCSVVAGAAVPIQRLENAYPSIREIGLESQHSSLLPELVAFSDCLGSGNMMCFHRESGEVYFFDHDSGPPLTRFFANVDEYLEALMLKTLAKVHEADDDGEPLLRERLGDALVRKWMY